MSGQNAHRVAERAAVLQRQRAFVAPRAVEAVRPLHLGVDRLAQLVVLVDPAVDDLHLDVVGLELAQLDDGTDLDPLAQLRGITDTTRLDVRHADAPPRPANLLRPAGDVARA